MSRTPDAPDAEERVGKGERRRLVCAGHIRLVMG